MLAAVFAVTLAVAMTPAFGVMECPEIGTNLVVTEEPQKIFSPGYPDFYSNSGECFWYLAVDKQASDLAIQIVTLKMDVNDYKEDCTSDYIEAIAGSDEQSGASIARWCGKEKKVIKYRGTHLVLKFHSDHQFSGAGFILAYSLVKLSSATCRQDAPRSISVGDSPIYEVLKGSPEVTRCQWYISAANTASKLVIELFKPSETMGVDNWMTLYEGAEANGEVNFEWDPKESLFSKIYLSTFDATLVLTGDGNEDENEDGVILKFSTRDPSSYAADCTRQTPATLEFHDDPILFSMPFTTDRRSGQPCALVLRNSDDKNIRLDAIGVKDAILTCENEPVNVINSNSTAVLKACNRGQTPVYFNDDSWLTITIPYQRTMFLMASQMDKRCNGLIQEVTAYRDLIVTDSYPRTDRYMNLAKCRIRVTASGRNDSVMAKITWKIPASQSPDLYSNNDACDGDYLNVYDGHSESNRILYSSCHQSDRSDRDVVAEVVSSRRSLFIEFDADKHFVSNSMTIEVHSMPGAHHCQRPIEIKVGNGTTAVTSPNFPGPYPLNQECDYILRSIHPNPYEDIVIKVINAKMPASCQDILTIYKGEDMKDEDMVGRVCGQDEDKIIRVENPIAVMRFISNEDMAHQGWNVEVTVEKRDSSAGSRVESSPILAMIIFSLASIISIV